MNKLLIGLGIGVLTLFMGMTLLRANNTFDDFSPMTNVEEDQAYYPSRHGYGPGRCHGTYDGESYTEEDTYFQHHDWMYGSMFSHSEIEQYNQLDEAQRETYEVMYARRVNALDLESMGDDALSDKLTQIRQEVFEDLLGGESVE